MCLFLTKKPQKLSDMITRIVILIFFTFLYQYVFSQKLVLSGKVIDGVNANPLPGATLILEKNNSAIAVQSDFDGNYSFKNLEAGTYKLKCHYVSYKTFEAENIVVKDRIENFDIILTPISKEISEVFVTGTAQIKTEQTIVLQQKKSSVSLSAISSEQISKMGDADAASAMKRITGVSIEGGKYVFVRGLSDRYSKVVLNSVDIPSLDPNKNSVQLDLFSSNIIENIFVQKTYSADLPASFAGGYININTKSIPNSFTLQVSSSFSYNPQGNLNANFISYQGGKTDWLGFDDGTRSIPNLAKNGIPFLYQNNDLLDRISMSFNKIMAPSRKTSFLNNAHSISFGNSYKVGKREIGLIFDFLYSHDFKYYNNGNYSRYQLNIDPNNNQYVMYPILLENEEYGEEDVIYSFLLGLSYKISNFDRINLNVIKNGGGLSTTRVRRGSKINDNLMIVENTLGYYQRSFITFQLSGRHLYNKKNKINWVLAFTNSEIDEPDLRFFNYDHDSTLTHFNISYSAYPAPARFYRDLFENNFDNKINFQTEFKKIVVKYGVAYNFKYRFSESKKFDILSQGVVFNGDINDYLADSNIGQNASNASYGVYYQNDTITDKFNSYNAIEHLAASYFSVEANLSKSVKILAGLRYEFNNIFVENHLPAYHPKYINANKTYLYDFLPTINITKSFNENSNIRIAYSRTLARPAFKEIAPYAYYDFKEGWRIVGNPDLKRTLVNNFDVRYEFFGANSQLFSVAIFYKYFINPIELIDDPRANNTELHYVNIDNSDLYGFEIEARKDFAFVNLPYLLVGTNFSYIKSEVKYVENYGGTALEPITRPMYGQSPWVFNLFVSYDNLKKGISSNISFYEDGKKLAIVTKGKTPDVYSFPIPMLNWNISKKLGRWVVKFSFSNILDPLHIKGYNYDNKLYIFQSYRIGRSFGLSVKYNIN